MLFTAFALAILSPQAPLPTVQVNRAIQIRVLDPNRNPVPAEDFDCFARVELMEEHTGWPLLFGAWPREVDDLAHGFDAAIGSRLEVMVYAPPHPPKAIEWKVLAGSEAQRVVLQLQDPKPMRQLRVDLVVPPTAPQWPEYVFQIRLPESGVSFLRLDKKQIHKGIALPAGLYEVVATGHSIQECGNSPPFQANFVPYLTRVDLRNGDKAVRIRPVVGRNLRVIAIDTRPAGPNRVPALTPEDWPSPLYNSARGGPDYWVRPSLRNLETGKEIPMGWGWGTLAFFPKQAGIPLGMEAYSTEQLPVGSYELLLRGRGIEPFRQRIEVTHDMELPITLAPAARR